MKKIFITSDEHYFHCNILKYCNRPFIDVNTMNTKLIKYHNEIVSPEDIVYHVGDFAMLRKDKANKIEPILNKLNGSHCLILGNHEENHAFSYLKLGFASVHTSLFVDEFLLIHDPAHAVVVDVSQKVLCGHLHQLCLKVADNILNVGVDVWNYRPISLDYIRENWQKILDK